MMFPVKTTKFASAALLESAHAPNECMDRAQRLAAVKFVGLSQPEPQPEPSSFSQILSRVVGLLAVARR
jgi:hypothetical protein